MASKRQCQRALDLHGERLGGLTNVVGLGVVADEGAEARACVVAVYVERLVPANELEPSDRIPKFIEIPGRGKSINRVRTCVIEQGPVSLETPGREPLE